MLWPLVGWGRRKRLSDYNGGFIRCAARLLRRYFDHHVAHDSAALTYYLFFALFPLLIFLNNLLALWALDLEALLRMFAAVIPRDVLDLTRQYLSDLSRASSRTLLWFSLVFTVYFPYRAVNALFLSVRKAYGANPPERFLRHSLRVLLYTLLMIVTLVFALAVSVVGRRALEFAAGYVRLSGGFIALWTRLRFVFLGAVLFAMIALLYALSLDKRQSFREIWPGVLASLAAWLGLSVAFSLYVERAARYSLIYGSIGTVIVLLLWLYLSATTLILGAEFNRAVLDNPIEKQRRIL